VTIKLTKHAKTKMIQRHIALDDVREIVLKPDLVEQDRFDKSLKHFIGSKSGKFLRVIGRQESTEDFLVISAFFDRRLKRETT